MNVRDRIKELRRVPASELRANPKNWREHPESQRKVVAGILSEIGYAGALLARETEEGLLLIDGHLRAETTPDSIVPVLILDVTAEEGDKLLALLDPVAAMAQANDQKISELLASIDSDNADVDALLEQLANEHEVDDTPTTLKKLDVKPPPKMTWALIGIPTSRYGEIAQHIEALSTVPDAIVELTVNDVEVESDDGEEERQLQPAGETGTAQAPAAEVPRRRKR